MKLDPKVRNLVLYSSQRLLSIICTVYLYIKLTQEYNIVRLVGHFVFILVVSRCILWIVRRKFIMPSQPWKHAKWVIAVDNGDSGCLLTYCFASFVMTHLHMNVCIFSNNQSKLGTINDCLSNNTNNIDSQNNLGNISNSFGNNNDISDRVKPQIKLVYADSSNLMNVFETHLKMCDQDGGIGLFMNTLCHPILNQPSSCVKRFEQYYMNELNAVVQQQLLPSVCMSSLVLQCMKSRRQGAILHVCPSVWDKYDRVKSYRSPAAATVQAAIRSDKRASVYTLCVYAYDVCMLCVNVGEEQSHLVIYLFVE